MRDERVRFAVVGLGNIAQAAVLPAFRHAREGCVLAALLSSDPKKIAPLSKEYDIQHCGPYEDLEDVLADAEIDAAYVAVPNSLHREMTERCARAGVHVLCEKPMAMSTRDCQAMIRTCDDNDVKLMIAYRLHFDPANLRAIELARSGKLGHLRHFTSTFAHDVRADDIRTKSKTGGGALFDLAIYCVNAARNLFGDEPEEVCAFQSLTDRGVDETTTAILRFPGDRFAQLTASQSAADADVYRIGGTRGTLRVEPAFDYRSSLAHHLTIGKKTTTKKFPRSDQFAPELLHFAECIVDDEEPEPSGEEGLADVRVLEALVESARLRQPVTLAPFERRRRPSRALERTKPPVRRPTIVRAPGPDR
ncbi:MAG: Gfo/Idh/MocA family oxidoreductase [Labilithrix sp.]|nr:Gfo/Idh/MocA family oxidoreductase [Labilithrix sp.]